MGDAFNELKDRIHRLKTEKDEITTTLLKDRENMMSLDSQIRSLEIEIQYLKNGVNSKETILKDYDTILNESTKAYDKITKNAFNLHRALDAENEQLQSSLGRLQRYKNYQ